VPGAIKRELAEHFSMLSARFPLKKFAVDKQSQKGFNDFGRYFR
jgi:hypothetical protein